MSSALKRNGSTTRWRKLREQVLIRDGRMCVTCGADEGLQVDHIVERQHGGTDHMDNLQTLCETCHKVKTAGLFYTHGTPPTPLGSLSPRNSHKRAHRTGSSSIPTESVSHG